MVRHPKRQFTARGFTLIELLVVISIIVLLIAILLPSLRHARYNARVVVCKSQLRQITNGLLNYTTSNSAWYPVAENPRHWFNRLAVNGGAQDNIRPLIKPYFQDDSLQLMICPLTAELYPNGIGSEIQIAYNIYPNSFGRGVVTGISGGAYQVTIDSIDKDRIKQRLGENFLLKRGGNERDTDPQFNLIASDVCKYWQFNPPTGPVLNHYQPGGNYVKSHDYTNVAAWVSSISKGSANYAREDGSVVLYDGISEGTRHYLMIRQLGDMFPVDEQLN